MFILRLRMKPETVRLSVRRGTRATSSAQAQRRGAERQNLKTLFELCGLLLCAFTPVPETFSAFSLNKVSWPATE
jgi:hypothetical protein